MCSFKFVVRIAVLNFATVCVYYCRTYYKPACGGEGDSGGHVL
jgi:hypothetical protein